MNLPENILLAGTVDHTYGLYGVSPESERIGAFAAPTQDLHGIYLPDSVVGTGEGVFYEAAAFCRLLTSCESEMMALLHMHASKMDTLTESGEELLDNRGIFLSADAVRSAFMTEAAECVDFMDVRLGDFSPGSKARTAAQAQHLLRLCWQGFHLYSTGYYPAIVDEPKRFFAFGQRVAEGNIDEARGVLAQYQQKFSVTKSALPDAPDIDSIDRWLRFTRLKFL